jgi:hypothetical protein
MWTLFRKETLIGYWLHVQHELLPWLDDAVGPLGEHHRQLVGVLGLALQLSFPFEMSATCLGLVGASPE